MTLKIFFISLCYPLIKNDTRFDVLKDVRLSRHLKNQFLYLAYYTLFQVSDPYLPLQRMSSLADPSMFFPYLVQLTYFSVNDPEFDISKQGVTGFKWFMHKLICIYIQNSLSFQTRLPMLVFGRPFNEGAATNERFYVVALYRLNKYSICQVCQVQC